jgi:hypothetical protein
MRIALLFAQLYLLTFLTTSTVLNIPTKGLRSNRMVMGRLSIEKSF